MYVEGDSESFDADKSIIDILLILIQLKGVSNDVPCLYLKLGFCCFHIQELGELARERIKLQWQERAHFQAIEQCLHHMPCTQSPVLLSQQVLCRLSSPLPLLLFPTVHAVIHLLPY